MKHLGGNSGDGQDTSAKLRKLAAAGHTLLLGKESARCRISYLQTGDCDLVRICVMSVKRF